MTHKMTNTNLQGANGVYHAQFMGLCFSKFLKRRCIMASHIMLEDPNELIDLIELDKQWEPAPP